MPQAEVIQEWADFDSAGCTFERGRMEKNVQDICFKQPAGVPEALKDPRHGVKLKQADIQALADEFLLPTHMAEQALVAAGGNMGKASSALTYAP